MSELDELLEEANLRDFGSGVNNRTVDKLIAYVRRTAQLESDLKSANDGWDESSEAWGRVLKHRAVRAELEADEDLSLMEATLRALDRVEL